MIKTTRLKTSQVAKNITYDLTPQVDGVTQTFELPEKVYNLDQHYVLFNGQVYRNDGNYTFYTNSADGKELTTLFDEAPRPGASYVLQFVKTESSEGENAVTKDYVDNKFQEKLTPKQLQSLFMPRFNRQRQGGNREGFPAGPPPQGFPGGGHWGGGGPNF